MTDYGSDVSTFFGPNQDLDPNFGIITGPQVVAEAVARRLMTPGGGGLWYDHSYGFDLRLLLNAPITASRLGLVASAIEAEVRKDERVLSAAVTVTQRVSASALAIEVILTTAAGPFALVLNVTALAITLITPS